MKNLIGKIIICSLILTGISCSENNKLDGTYVREIPTKKKDSIFVTHLKDNIFHFEAHEWNNGKRKSKSSTATLEGNTIYFDNNNSVILTKDNDIVVGKTKYIKIN